MEEGFSSSEILLSRSSNIEFFSGPFANAEIMTLIRILLKSYSNLYQIQTLYLDI